VNAVELQDRKFFAAIRPTTPRRDWGERRTPDGGRTARPARRAESCLSRANARPHPARGTRLQV